MGLSAWTNRPGSHDKYESVIGRQHGKYYGADNIDEVIYAELKVYENASKWYPTPGYSGCTDWSRSIRKVTSDHPARWRRYIKEGNPPDDYVTVDLYGDHHISLDHRLGSYVVPDPGYDNGRNESITKALNQLTSHYAGIGNDLGEARKTCDSFAALVLRAGSFLHAVRHLQWLEALKSLGLDSKGRNRPLSRTIADLWLELNYGWKPLAKDLFEVQELAHEALKKPVPIKAIGHGSSSNEVSFLWENTYYHSGKSSTSHRTCLLANVTNPNLHMLSQAGLINPVSIAWELVPFSFVIDWFVPVGATLQAITAGVGLESLGGFTSSQTHDNLTMTRKTNFEGYGYGYVDAGDYREAGFSFHRQCHTSFPAPKLYADVTPYSTPRALNALALIRQLV